MEVYVASDWESECSLSCVFKADAIVSDFDDDRSSCVKWDLVSVFNYNVVDFHTSAFESHGSLLE